MILMSSKSWGSERRGRKRVYTSGASSETLCELRMICLSGEKALSTVTQGNPQQQHAFPDE
jgi:hypothetical protein